MMKSFVSQPYNPTNTVEFVSHVDVFANSDLNNFFFTDARLGMFNRAHRALGQATLVAPFDGTVSEIHVREGEQVISGFSDQPVLTLGDLSTIRVETTDLRETDVGRIALDQEVDITFDALPDTLLKGHVVYISPKADSEQGGVNYTTIIEFDELDPRLRWGMTAYVNITAD